MAIELAEALSELLTIIAGRQETRTLPGGHTVRLPTTSPLTKAQMERVFLLDAWAGTGAKERGLTLPAVPPNAGPRDTYLPQTHLHYWKGPGGARLQPMDDWLAEVKAIVEVAAETAPQASEHCLFGGRLRFDDATKNVFYDGQPFTVAHPVAYRILRFVAQQEGTLVTGQEIKNNVPGCAGRIDTVLKAKLPQALRALLFGQPGPNGGYSIRLPQIVRIDAH